MNPFAPLEKLINEHGSATILKERLALAADQYSTLERKIAELEKLNSELYTKNQELTSQLQQRTAETYRLQNQLKEKSSHIELDEDELRVLRFIVKQPGNNHHGVAHDLQLHEEAANFVLLELRGNGLAERRGLMEHRWEWHPTQDGRRFLKNRGEL